MQIGIFLDWRGPTSKLSLILQAQPTNLIVLGAMLPFTKVADPQKVFFPAS